MIATNAAIKTQWILIFFHWPSSLLKLFPGYPWSNVFLPYELVQFASITIQELMTCARLLQNASTRRRVFNPSFTCVTIHAFKLQFEAWIALMWTTVTFRYHILAAFRASCASRSATTKMRARRIIPRQKRMRTRDFPRRFSNIGYRRFKAYAKMSRPSVATESTNRYGTTVGSA